LFHAVAILTQPALRPRSVDVFFQISSLLCCYATSILLFLTCGCRPNSFEMPRRRGSRIFDLSAHGENLFFAALLLSFGFSFIAAVVYWLHTSSISGRHHRKAALVIFFAPIYFLWLLSCCSFIRKWIAPIVMIWGPLSLTTSLWTLLAPPSDHRSEVAFFIMASPFILALAFMVVVGGVVSFGFLA
jgi:hypothetical protein